MTVKANVVLFIFGLFRNWISEFPKNFSKGKNRFCVFSDLSENDFRTFPKTSRTMFWCWKFSDLSEKFSECPKNLSLTLLFVLSWNFRTCPKIFRNIRKSQLLCITGRIWAVAINSPLPSLVRAAGSIPIICALGLLSLSLALLSLAFLFPLSPVFDLDLVCVWELWIRVCVSACCWLREDLWALASSPGVLCFICYSWRLRTPRRPGVALEPPIYLWLAGTSLWRLDVTSEREEIPLVEGGVLSATSWGKG